MQNKKKIMSIMLEDGSIDEVEVLILFEFSDTKKEYIVYTKNEKDDSGNVTIYVSTFNRKENGEYSLTGISTDDEWGRIKEVLRELSKDTEN